MADTLRENIDHALADAHLPALLVTLAHLTGDTSLLRPEWYPKYIPYTDNRFGGLSPDKQTALRDLARRKLDALGIGKSAAKDPPQLSQGDLHTLMNFVAGADVPARYLPLMRDELGLDSAKLAGVHFKTPALRKAAAKTKVVVVGAGMSGIMAAVRLKQAGIDFTLVERNSEVGGTWFENTYPGCRVDSQNHIYSYSFAPNHDWPQHYSTQNVLLDYFQGCVAKFGLRENIRMATSVEEAAFDEGEGNWRVTLKHAGKTEVIVADAVISSVGQLNKPRIPEIKGREDFKGAEFHSARWRHDIDLKGKRVAIVGTGASSFQFAPAVAKEAAHLDIYQRSAPWMAPTPDYHFDVGEGQKWLLHNLPGYASWYRFWLFWSITDGVYESVKVDPAWEGRDGAISGANKMIREALVARMTEQIGDRTDLIDKVIPKYPFGGKRTLRDASEWIPMLRRDNVSLVTDRIAKMTPDAIVTSDGIERPADVVIYGTGFHATHLLEPMKIVGRLGVELTQSWADDARAYLGMTVPGFPNFFCIYGPNTNLVVNGSIVFFSECSMNYILGCLELLASKHRHWMEPKTEVFEVFNEKVDAQNSQMAWGLPGVDNWYKNASGRVTQNWPFPLVDYWNATRAPNPDEFIFG